MTPPGGVKGTEDIPIASDSGVPGVQKARRGRHAAGQEDGVDEGVGGDDDDDDDDSDWSACGGP